MRKITKNIQVLWYHVWVIATITLIFSFMCTRSFAEQPTVTISSLNGDVQVALQGKGTMAAATGTVLQAGDTIQTLSGAEAVLELSDGSELELGENTSIDIAELIQESTGARTSRVKLLWGWIRATLSAGHQEEGSSFTIETPNALIGVKFSQPIVEVGYDPTTDTTTIDAQTVDVIVTILATQRVELLQKGQQGSVRKRSFSLSTQSRPSHPSEEPQKKIPPETQEKVPVPQKGDLPTARPSVSFSLKQSIDPRAFSQMRNSVRGAAGATVPISVGPVGPREPGALPPIPGTGGSLGTAPIPSPGVRLDRPEQQHRIIMIHIYR
jgi:hypothetical protein